MKITINYYYKYYLEIKNRFFLIIFAWVFTALICTIYKNSLLFIIVDSKNTFSTTNEQSYFIFTNITEIFYIYVNIIIFISNQISLIFSLYHLIVFLMLGLYKSELIKLKFFFKSFILILLISTLLLYKFIIPFNWNFFLNFQQNNTPYQPIPIFFEAKLIEYINYFIGLYYICFISCQFLIFIVILLTNLTNNIKNFRKFFYLIFLIFSTLITPPDIFSQILITFVLIFIYESVTFLKYLKINLVTN